jgi:H3 lysine-79-specific histone-lysine N-methyltransferase|tara:strand:+ start:859 stop:1533 length:675 start_codon:yes stop_codon:yes gene_type:complete
MLRSVAVPEPAALNKNYKPFSHEVYGETNANLVQFVIDSQAITSDDVFVDLGSGIGQVVLQVAASTQCRAFGIELMETPAQYANAYGPAFATELQRRGCGLRHETTLIHGDFMKFAQLSSATVIFINNFAFPCALSQQLGAHIAATCSAGTRVLSYKPITPMRKRQTKAPQRFGFELPAGSAVPLWVGAQEEEHGLVKIGCQASPGDGVSWMSGTVDCISYVLR